ncbi:MAG: hypothetical protein OEO77_01320 [Acidimicrobiia bacterium]|nr:hypothetical protein [Acidimicrobiia bacterium]
MQRLLRSCALAVLVTACSAPVTVTTPVPATSTVPEPPVATTRPSSTTSLAVTTTVPATTTTVVDGIVVTVASGAVSSEFRREVVLGDEVRIVVTADVSDEVHLHGYDLVADIEAGQTVVFEFVADIPGIFEMELEGARLPILELTVQR